MDSALRPRDIQARIRSGETPEIVAQAAQTTVETIMPFASPVLAERAHVALRAQRSSLRRAAEHGGARTLGEAVAARLRRADADPEAVAWDAWRRDDGRWALTATYAAGARTGTGHFAFDAPGNYVVTEDDEARWLVGEEQSSDGTPPGLAAVSSEDLPLGDDALGLFLDEVPAPPHHTDHPHDAATEDLTEAAVGIREGEPTPPVRRPVRKTRGRASVPSWDEIMFGGARGD